MMARQRAPAALFREGEVVRDLARNRWQLENEMSFHRIYWARRNTPEGFSAEADHAVKVERPSENRALFEQERQFYTEAANPDEIQHWMVFHGLTHLGVPRYWGSGLAVKRHESYRFMVIDRLGINLQERFEQGNHPFSRKLVVQLGLRLLDILEFIHDHEYVHGDIKPSHIMLSRTNPNQVFLADYGLAFRYATGPNHQAYMVDPERSRRDITEFTSIDGHYGIFPSRRGDLQSLAYCMVQWLGGRLPWQNYPTLGRVRMRKIRGQEHVHEFMADCFPAPDIPEIQGFVQEVMRLHYMDRPPYRQLRNILRAGLRILHVRDDGNLIFP